MPIRVYFLGLRRKQKIAAVVLGICLLLALAGAAFWLCIPIPAGVTADGLSLSGLSYLHARTLLKQELDTLPGVESVSINDSGYLAVDYDSTGVRQEDIRRKILDLGFSIKPNE